MDGDSDVQTLITGKTSDPLRGMNTVFDYLSAQFAPSEDPVAQIDQMALARRISSAAAAMEVAIAVKIEQTQRAQQIADNWKPSQVGKGIGEQVGLACRTSPSGGALYLSFARSLTSRFPRVFHELRFGQVGVQACKTVVTKTSHLTDEQAAQLDAELAPLMQGWNPAQTEKAVCAAAYRVDPQGWVDRRRNAERERRVWIRPAPDTMSIVSALLPAAQGVAIFAHLTRAAQTAVGIGDERGLGQVMADTLVERVTGQTSAAEVPTEVLLTVTPETLFAGGSQPAWLDHYGAIPAELARALASGGDAESTDAPTAFTPHEVAAAKVWIRRVLTDPVTGVAVNIDQKRRLFDGTVRRLITIRDRECRGPFCSAPIREIDHVIPHAAGGPTAIGNGQGVCKRNNQLKELKGWTVIKGKKPGELITRTPTGHTYRTSPPPQIGYPAGTIADSSPLEPERPTAA